MTLYIFNITIINDIIRDYLSMNNTCYDGDVFISRSILSDLHTIVKQIHKEND